MAQKTTIEYKVIFATDAEKVITFLVSNFFPNEPISRGFGLPIDQVTRWFPSQIQECLKSKTSVAAIDANSGELLGVAVNIVVEKTLSGTAGEKKEGRGLVEILDAETEPVMLKIAEFLAILNQVPDSVYELETATQPQTLKTFNCIYLAVLPSHAGQGIGKQLVQESEKIAKQLKIGILQVDTTSAFSYQIFHKHCGYKVVREIDLAQYINGMENVDGGVHKKGRILLKKIQL